MKPLVALLAFALLASTARAEQVVNVPCQESFKGLPKLAKRLGVKPSPAGSGAFTLRTCDGASYDMFALINSLLDKMEHVSRAQAKE